MEPFPRLQSLPPDLPPVKPLGRVRRASAGLTACEASSSFLSPFGVLRRGPCSPSFLSSSSALLWAHEAPSFPSLYRLCFHRGGQSQSNVLEWRRGRPNGEETQRGTEGTSLALPLLSGLLAAREPERAQQTAGVTCCCSWLVRALPACLSLCALEPLEAGSSPWLLRKVSPEEGWVFCKHQVCSIHREFC